MRLAKAFSCEINPEKQNFIASMFKDHGLGALFGDVKCLQAGCGVNWLFNEVIAIPNCSDFYAGFPCQDRP